MTGAEALPDAAAALAIDVGGTTIKGELVDRHGEVLASARRPTPTGAAALDAIGEVGDDLVTHASAHTVLGAGVVVPGLVDPVGGVASYSANIGWDDLHLSGPLAERWGVPVRLGHDVAAAAMAETRQGAGRGRSHVAFVVIGTGIAAAIVTDGRLVTGHRGEIAELGHVPVRPGTPCPCGGDGCLEAVASASAIARNYTELSGRQVQGAADVVSLLPSDPDARQVWQAAVDALADGLAVLSLIAAPELVVIGGGLGGAGADLVGPLSRAVEQRTRVVTPARVTVAALGDRGGVVGAAMQVFDPWATR